MLLTIVGIIIAALFAGLVVWLTIKITKSFFQKFRKKNTSKIVCGKVKDIAKNAPTVNLDDLPDDDDVIIAEFDEDEDELTQDIAIARNMDIDPSIEKILNDNGGIVVFE